MRLYLLPISTRRTLLYCQRLNSVSTTQNKSLLDKVQDRAAKIWTEWEKKDKGWQKTVVNWGNQAFRRIPYEEWGLKSVPPLSSKRKADELKGADSVEVVYPKTLIAMDKVPLILEKLATERESLHRKRLLWCFVGMPITAPIGIIPLVPNLPFFYLVYRAWSHWRALKGGQHIQFLLRNKLLTMAPSPIVDEVYAGQEPPLASTAEPTTESGAIEVNAPEPSAAASSGHADGETMLLTQANATKMTQALDLPQLEVELERAIWQVETAIRKQNDELSQKERAESAGSEKGAVKVEEVSPQSQPQDKEKLQ